MRIFMLQAAKLKIEVTLMFPHILNPFMIFGKKIRIFPYIFTMAAQGWITAPGADTGQNLYR